MFTALGAPKVALEFAKPGVWAFSIPALGKIRQVRIAGAGGGMTVVLTPDVSVREAVDYRRIVFTDADEFDADDSQVRAIAGVVFGWGAR